MLGRGAGGGGGEARYPTHHELKINIHLCWHLLGVLRNRPARIWSVWWNKVIWLINGGAKNGIKSQLKIATEPDFIFNSNDELFIHAKQAERSIVRCRPNRLESERKNVRQYSYSLNWLCVLFFFHGRLRLERRRYYWRLGSQRRNPFLSQTTMCQAWRMDAIIICIFFSLLRMFEPTKEEKNWLHFPVRTKAENNRCDSMSLQHRNSIRMKKYSFSNYAVVKKIANFPRFIEIWFIGAENGSNISHWK